MSSPTRRRSTSHSPLDAANLAGMNDAELQARIDEIDRRIAMLTAPRRTSTDRQRDVDEDSARDLRSRHSPTPRRSASRSSAGGSNHRRVDEWVESQSQMEGEFENHSQRDSISAAVLPRRLVRRIGAPASIPVRDSAPASVLLTESRQGGTAAEIVDKPTISGNESAKQPGAPASELWRGGAAVATLSADSFQKSDEDRQKFAVQTGASEKRKISSTIKLGMYGGNSSQETFLAKFGNCSDYYQWTAHERVCHLKASLDGPAGRVLWGLNSQTTEAEIIRQLHNRFGNVNQVERFRAELRNRRRQPGETLHSVYQDILRLLYYRFAKRR